MDDKLRQIQLCQLEILKEIVRICDKNEIDYWLAYGTMLGAVRHQGFIPWDDDVDIYMTMEGFQRFQKCCKTQLKDQYFLQTPSTEPTMGWLFYKVRKNDTQMLEPGQTANNTSIHHGIWVDIFPLITLASSPSMQALQFSILRKLQFLRGCHPALKHHISVKECLRVILNYSIGIIERLLWFVAIQLGSKKYGKVLDIENEFYPHMTDAHIKKHIFNQTLFTTTQQYKFEDSLFKGVADYDGYLTTCYSDDYMTPKKYNTHTEDYSQVVV